MVTKQLLGVFSGEGEDFWHLIIWWVPGKVREVIIILSVTVGNPFLDLKY